MADDDYRRSAAIIKDAPNQAEPGSELEAARDAFNDALTEHNIANTPETGRKRLEAALRLVDLTRVRDGRAESAALAVLFYAVEDALNGNLWPEMDNRSPGNTPSPHTEKGAIHQAVRFVADAHAGQVDRTPAEAKKTISKKYTRDVATVNRWCRDAGDLSKFVTPWPIDTPERKKRHREGFERLLDHQAKYIRAQREKPEK